MSTAYVNCYQKGGIVHETVYEDDKDVDEFVGSIMKMSIDEAK